MSTPRTVAFHTLGCKLNFSESSTIGSLFKKAGYDQVPFQGSSDIYVINTCSVTDEADKKCRKAVRSALRQNPEAEIIVIGCYAQLKPKEIADIPGVDLVLGAAEKFRILDYIGSNLINGIKTNIHCSKVSDANQFIHSQSLEDRTRSFLKVQDGCDYKCSFCTIPQARGKSRSPYIKDLVAAAEKLIQRGVKEIVLTGVNIGDFGKNQYSLAPSDVHKKETFFALIQELDQLQGCRFRISSIEPNLCSHEIVDFVSNSKNFMPHFHMPLQSGNNDILAAMKRRYRTDLYTDRVNYIKSKIPDACIGVDVIVGFPGESEEHFLSSYQFIQELMVNYLHVFSYSERENTPAAMLSNSVPVSERRRRSEMLRILSDKKQRAFYSQYQSAVFPVLLEKSKHKGYLEGWTPNYIRVRVKGHEHEINALVPLSLSRLDEEMCFLGTAVAESNA